LTKAIRGLAAVLALLAAAGCAPFQGPTAPITGAAPSTECQIVYDAGSSGTRLFIYALQDGRWVEHPGPKSAALADPVRQIRGRSHADIPGMTTDVVAQLDRIRSAGPSESGGKPQWQAFDWMAHCRVTDAMVLATAGMRIAEQEDPVRSRQLWAGLRAQLQARLGRNVRVSARTLTGFEEGFFAWLAVREERADHRFGIVEMGGASSQVTFPCARCDPADDAVRTVRVKGLPLQIYSYSFLGLGQDEAPRTLGMAESCAYGVGLSASSWQRADCEGRIDLGTATAMKDPYNHSLPAQAGQPRGTSRQVPTRQSDASDWVLTGAFIYASPDAVATCCLHQGACYHAQTSCFRAVYLDKFLATLGIPVQSAKADVSWTEGVVLCAASRCLAAASPPVCRWSAGGCL
jgi:hypothetical protein